MEDKLEALSDQQINELTKLIIEVEKFYGFPVDIEWAFANNRLYLLQSRPITTYVPLPKEMQTKPGNQRVLYLDGSLIKQGINVPITVMGCDCITVTQQVMFEDLMGKDVTADILTGLATTRGGRMYINVSSTAKFQGTKRMANTWEMVDITSANMMRELNLESYIPKKTPEILKGGLCGGGYKE